VDDVFSEHGPVTISSDGGKNPSVSIRAEDRTGILAQHAQVY
jgi:hypothetical protein